MLINIIISANLIILPEEKQVTGSEKN